jgi:hypothetical protein
MVSISQQWASPVILYSKQKKRDITSLLGQMCPPAASSASFRKLGPIVPLGAGQVIGACSFPGVVVGRARLIVVDGTSSLDRGSGAAVGEGPGQGWWRWRLQGEGALRGFHHLAGKGALAAAVATVMVRHVGVVDRAVVPKIGVPLWQDAVGVVAIDVWSRAPMTPMAHLETVETKPLHRSVCTHHVTWTTPSDDNCRRAVDGT